ncbi:MAG: DedA family protein [Deltaproteobacteria bacterium]
MIEAILAWAFNFVTNAISTIGYWGIALCMAIESCNIPLPSELIMPFGGYLVSTGEFTFWDTVLAGTAGGTVGSVASYYIGRFAMHSPLLFWVSDNKKGKLIRWFEKHGESTAFFSRLLPGIRTFISLPAGAAGMNIFRFTFYTIIGTFLWCWFLAYLGYVLGSNWTILSVYFHEADLIVLIGLIGIIIYYLIRRKLRK